MEPFDNYKKITTNPKSIVVMVLISLLISAIFSNFNFKSWLFEIFAFVFFFLLTFIFYPRKCIKCKKNMVHDIETGIHHCDNCKVCIKTGIGYGNANY
jgi:ATP/ADP translocase